MISSCAAMGFSIFIRTVHSCNTSHFDSSPEETVSACFGIQNRMVEASHTGKVDKTEPIFIFLDANTIESHKGMLQKATSQKVYVFDIDETLYPHDDHILKMRKENIVKLGMLHGFSEEEAKKKMIESLAKYKSTIKGFICEHPRNERVIEALYNPIPNATETLKPDNDLRRMLLKLNGRRVCLTNGPRAHSRSVLEKLGILDCFEAVFCCDYHNTQYLSKPIPAVYNIVSRLLEIGDTSSVYFFEDRYENITSAIPFGWRCFHVTRSMPLKLILGELLESNCD